MAKHNLTDIARATLQSERAAKAVNRAIAVLLVALLIGCSSSYTRSLEQNLTAERNLTAMLRENLSALHERNQELSGQVFAGATRVADAKHDADMCSVDLQLAETKLTRERTQRQAAEDRYTECITKYAPKPTVSSGTYKSITYDELMRNAEIYIGTKVAFTGEVLQVSNKDAGSYVLRVAVTEKPYTWTDAVWVEYDGPRVLEDDIVTFRGEFTGLQTYTAVLGNDITVPRVDAEGITVVTKAGDR